jgi:ketosteroid isomerase-like protein
MKEAISKLQLEFDEAELNGDKEGLRRLLTDDFLSIGPRGFMLDKQAWIGRHDHFKYHSLQSREVDLRLYEGAAIVRNIQHNRASYRGEEQEHTVRVSQIWVKVQSEWRLAGIQFSPLVTP